MISVFTPSHSSQFLDDCYRSLKAQTFTDWEWIVLLNGGARDWGSPEDTRVKVTRAPEVQGVGAAKRAACLLTTGDILVELDHDDVLASTCLEEVDAAFRANPEAALVFSDFAQVNADLTSNEDRFDPSFGWRYWPAHVDGTEYLRCLCLAATPHNVSYVWFAPNHVRAFRREAYETAGGYDPTRDVLDDQELMSRLYQFGEFVHIPKTLYLQRLHALNTQRHAHLNERIQRETVGLYDTHIEANALAWARRSGLLALDLGAAHGKPQGYLGVDQHPGDGVDMVCDVSKGIDLPDQSVGVIRAYDFLEHVADKVGLFNEIYRLLAHGGLLLSLTPSTDGRGAFQDPTHCAYYNANSFWYFTEAKYAAYVPEIKCKFQTSRLVTYFPSPWHEEHIISYVRANLIALHGGSRQGGPMFW